MGKHVRVRPLALFSFLPVHGFHPSLTSLSIFVLFAFKALSHVNTPH
jgi:hypothetical protein